MERRNTEYVRGVREESDGKLKKLRRGCKFLMLKVCEGDNRKELAFIAILVGWTLGNFSSNNMEKRMKKFAVL